MFVPHMFGNVFKRFIIEQWLGKYLGTEVLKDMEEYVFPFKLKVLKTEKVPILLLYYYVISLDSYFSSKSLTCLTNGDLVMG